MFASFLFTERRLLVALLVLVVLGLILTSRPFLRLVFPLYYQEVVEKAARRYNLDQWLLYAMIRVESGFDPQARSSKGALGLMQLMPETARWIAATRGISSFNPALLYDPELNVEFGSWYLRTLLNEFGGDEVLALAAYNGGGARVRRWLEEERWTGERETLHQIPFGETRWYVERVLTVRRWYAWLYSREGYFFFPLPVGRKPRLGAEV